MESAYDFTWYTECDREVKLGLDQIKSVQDMH